jgi:hypothetical protein
VRVYQSYRYPPFNQVPKSKSGHKEAMFSLFYDVAEVVIIQQENLATNEI